MKPVNTFQIRSCNYVLIKCRKEGNKPGIWLKLQSDRAMVESYLLVQFSMFHQNFFGTRP